MVKITNLVPKMEAVIRRGGATSNQEPTAENISRIKRVLEQAGYTQRNEKLYDNVVRYGAREYSKHNQKGLFLRGGVGVGKSFAIEVLAVEFKIPVINPIDLNGLYKDLEGDLFAIERNINLDFFERPLPLVAIDEIGSLNIVSHYGEKVNIMAEVLDMRYRAFLKYGSRTIATSNLNDNELREAYGWRIDDRLNEMFYFVDATGKSMRG